MKKKHLNYWLLAAFAVFTLFVQSCKSSEETIVPPIVVPSGVELSTNLKFTTLLTDNYGNTLYFYSKDVAGAATCVDACSVTWPPFYSANLTVGTGLNSTDFGVTTRPDGSKQTTYKGWPLYYYSKDGGAGDTNGDAFNNLWAVAKSDYAVMFANAQLVGNDGLAYAATGVAGTGTSQYITDPTGRTLYMYSRDTQNTNTYTAPDLSNNNVWLIAETTGISFVPTVLTKINFSTITVAGKTQIVYKGHPLYYFGQDSAIPGNTKGVSFPTPGAGVWKVVNTATAGF